MPDPLSTLTQHACLDPEEERGAYGEERESREERAEALRRKLTTARELAKRKADPVQTEVLPTGLAGLDRLLSGGVPRGEVVELKGVRSSGRFSCVLALLATTIGAGEVAALVDLGDQLAPGQAREHGIDLERLLWVRPRHLREALSAAEILLSSRFPLVVLDLGVPPVPGGRGAEASWLRLARAARRDDGALLVSSPYRVTGSAASEVVDLAPGTFRWRKDGASPALPAGLVVHAERAKSRRRPRIERTELSLWTREEAEMYLRRDDDLEDVGAATRRSPVPGRQPETPAPPRRSLSLSRPRTSRSWGYRRPAIPGDAADRALGEG